MGGAIARSMLRAGFEVVVHDLREEAMRPLVEAGAIAASSLETLVGQISFVSIVVVRDEEVRDVGGAVVAMASPGTIIAIHSTVRPTTVVALAEAGARRGVSVIDVAVNGGNEKASRGILTLMVGGDETAVRWSWPLLESIGAHIYHVGPVGSGLVGKLVNNLIAVGSYALELEAMQLAAAYDVDEDMIATVVSTSTGDSRGMRTWGRHDRKRRERAAQGTEWYERMGRDLQEAVIAGGLRGVELPLTAMAAGTLPSKLRRRDHELAQRPPGPPTPLCAFCGQELAAPFRAVGMHPECREP
jgi:3-hydroxyisobutyrate dehydrogenase-like beta-hydroxyacid dehydrogenase